MNNVKLELKNIFFSYPDGNKVLTNVSFKVFKGQSVGIIGANGAGKSTLLMLLMGVYFADRGEIWVEDLKITKDSLPFIRQKLGMVFQNSDDQLFMTSVFEDVAFGPRNFKLDENEVKKRVETALEIVGIKNLSNKAPYKLSGGEKKSVAIASVLSMQPQMLIMDEPTSELDPKARRRIIDLLNNFEHTKIITSHDLDMVLETCDRVLIIKDGEIAADGAAKDILSDNVILDRCGLEKPLSLIDCPLCGTQKNKRD